ncbi:hypothetical protein [Jannaschia pohangensis]|nr:hypothetical protein [Jannaschia pohangensis]
MRLSLALASLIVLPGGAQAWSFAPTPICTLSQAAFGLDTQVTFDPSQGLYTLTLTRPQGWPEAPVFAIRFDGASPLTISTDRHRVEGTRIVVTDSGFGNVLSGLEANTTATATVGDVSVRIDLAEAAGPVATFRACPATPSV